jgi:outer membrane protein OmpA-like peptidoglycan-associated protein
VLHRIRRWGRLLPAAWLALGCAAPAAAQDYEYGALPRWYAGALYGVLLPDSVRSTGQGSNIHGLLGLTLAEAVALELDGFSATSTPDAPGQDDTTFAGGGLGLTLGTPAPGNPFFMLGGGAVQQEIAGVSKTSSYGSLGIGAYLPFSLAGELWRLEGRYNVVFNDHPSLAAEELLEDGRVNLGVLFTFGERDRDEPPLEVAQAAPDSDGDGVPDSLDQCADTPNWVRVDERGCPPDEDGDGVDDARDACPASPAGTPVDATGCPVQEAVAPAAVADSDGDGVPDELDACPNTAAGMKVDEKGCVVPETVTLKNVHFDLESYRLTGDGFILLRAVGAAMKADPSMRLEISGHADSSGSSRYNQRLSARRAEVVRDFLNYLGIEERRMVVKAWGETRPIADNASEEGRAYNRRVEFRRLEP